MAFTKRFHSMALAGILASSLVGVGALCGMVPANAQGTNQIGVNVDSNPISFRGAQPIELHGSVLVPLRGVFEALGAQVTYDSEMQAVTAIRGDRTVIVPIGSSSATINGQPQPLSEPAQVINGSTMVPLRFVAEALGDYVEWGDQTHRVSITSIQPSPSVATIPPREIPSAPRVYKADDNIMTGVVRQVIADSAPRQIIVRINGVDREIPVTDSATVLRGRVGRDGESVALADVQPGDRVVIHRNDEGSAVRIASSFGLIYGTVSSVEIKGDGRRLVVLDDGQSIELASSARVMRDGAAIEPVDLTTGDHITIATDPDENIAYRITVNPPINAHRR